VAAVNLRQTVVLAVLACSILATTAQAQPGPGGIDPVPHGLRPVIKEQRANVQRSLANRCRPLHHWGKSVWDIPRRRLVRNYNYVIRERKEARGLSSWCDNPKLVIRATWPDSLERWAIAIAKRESHLQPRAQNEESGAAGLFQLMPMHWTLPGPCFDPFNALLNSIYARNLYRANGPEPWQL
jgi:hypothetical protein